MPHPNLLFVFTDEQRADTMAAYGNETIRTPNLNKFAADCTVFEKAYVTQPVCTPSRSTLLTGLYPHTNGCIANNVPLPPDVPCLPELFENGDYVFGYHGKWHLGDEIFRQHGFDEWVSVEDFYIEYYGAGRDRNARSDYHRFLRAGGLKPSRGELFGRGEAARLPECFSKPAFLAREARRFIDRNKNRPFVLFVNFLEPHMPFFGPRDGEHDPSEVTLPDNFSEAPGALAHPRARLLAELFRRQKQDGIALDCEAGWRRLIANYWGLCSLVDAYFGEILKALDEAGQADNTIVVFTSDHGDMMGSHGLVAKSVMYEEALRVPLLVRMPGQRGMIRAARPVSQIDVVPTLLELLGQPVPGELQGASFAGFLTGRGTAPARDVFAEWHGSTDDSRLSVLHGADAPKMPTALDEFVRDEHVLADRIRTVVAPDGWKLNLSAGGWHELYNLNEDPCERDNLAGNPRFGDKAQALAGRIFDWQKKTGDRLDFPDGILK